MVGHLFRIFSLKPGEVAPTPEYVFARTHPDDRGRVEAAVAALQDLTDSRRAEREIAAHAAVAEALAMGGTRARRARLLAELAEAARQRLEGL